MHALEEQNKQCSYCFGTSPTSTSRLLPRRLQQSYPFHRVMSSHFSPINLMGNKGRKTSQVYRQRVVKTIKIIFLNIRGRLIFFPPCAIVSVSSPPQDEDSHSERRWKEGRSSVRGSKPPREKENEIYLTFIVLRSSSK